MEQIRLKILLSLIKVLRCVQFADLASAIFVVEQHDSSNFVRIVRLHEDRSHMVLFFINAWTPCIASTAETVAIHTIVVSVVVAEIVLDIFTAPPGGHLVIEAIVAHVPDLPFINFGIVQAPLECVTLVVGVLPELAAVVFGILKIGFTRRFERVSGLFQGAYRRHSTHDESCKLIKHFLLFL